MKKRKTALALLLLGSVFSATGKDAGWQWYNESHRAPEDDKPSSTQPQQASPDIMDKLAMLQQATKRAMYEAILYPGVENFTRYFRLQNYWTQQAGLFSMSAKKAMLEHPHRQRMPPASRRVFLRKERPCSWSLRLLSQHSTKFG